jgi:hypothetical protein
MRELGRHRLRRIRPASGPLIRRSTFSREESLLVRFGRCRPVRKFDPDRRMIARFLPASRRAIDAGRLKARGDGRAQEQVVDAQSRVARVGVSEIVPEGVDALRQGAAFAGRRSNLARQAG